MKRVLQLYLREEEVTGGGTCHCRRAGGCLQYSEAWVRYMPEGFFLHSFFPTFFSVEVSATECFGRQSLGGKKGNQGLGNTTNLTQPTAQDLPKALMTRARRREGIQAVCMYHHYVSCSYSLGVRC